MRRLQHRWTVILGVACGLLVTPLWLLAAESARNAPTGPTLDVAQLQTLRLEPTARHEIAEAIGMHDYAKAEGTLLSEINRRPREARVYCFLGRLFFIDHKFLNTAIALKKAEALEPLPEKDRFTLAMAYVAMGRSEWAGPELQTLTTLAPHNALYPYWQGRLAYDRQDLVAAADLFRKAIALDGDFVKAHDNLGLCLEGSGKYEEAIEQYRVAVRLNREQKFNSAWPPLDLGSLLTRLDRLNEAQPALQESLQFNPDLAEAHFQLGVLLEKNHQLTSAIEELCQASHLAPSEPQSHYVLARVYGRVGNQEEAQRELHIFENLKANRPAGTSAALASSSTSESHTGSAHID